jgi:colanic acid/amylovoran biosynthesis glycosyltransferase
MTIAYLVNQYPKVSHSFIRREIRAIEASGIQVARFSIRSCESELVDPADQEELEKTRVVLRVGILRLFLELVRVFLYNPKKWMLGIWLAIKVGSSSKRGILIHIIYLAEACILLRWFDELGVTHVHAHFGTNSTTVAMLCHEIGGPPYSFTVHGPEEFDSAESLALREKINRANFVVAISSFGKSQLYRWCDYQQWKKIHIVHCGVDENFFNQNITSISTEPNIVCVGRLCEQKGHLLLLEAVHQLAALGYKCNLTLVGDGPLRPRIEALMKQYNLEELVKITGWASTAEVQQYILNSRVLVLPSFAEGLPVVIMEALALKRPVISTYIAGIPELVETGVNGWLVPAGEVEALTVAIRKALELPKEQLEQMGEAGFLSVIQKHNVATEASKLAKLFSYSQEYSQKTQNNQLTKMAVVKK